MSQLLPYDDNKFYSNVKLEDILNTSDDSENVTNQNVIYHIQKK